jgi:hypothetical protein
MGSASTDQRARRVALLPVAALVGLLAGCHSSTSTVGAPPAGPPPGTVVPPAAVSVAVTVAPASVAPGATRIGVPVPSIGAAPTAPALPPPNRVRYVPPCPWSPSPTQIALQVSPGSGSAVVRWTGDGDGTVRSYRVSAISQRLVAGTQPPPPTATTARGVGCGPHSVSFGGLRHGSGYVFRLEEAIPDPAGGLRYWQVGQSSGVLVR